MPSDKRNSETAHATGLIFSQFNVVWVRHVPFDVLQELECIYHRVTFVSLYLGFLKALHSHLRLHHRNSPYIDINWWICM